MVYKEAMHAPVSANILAQAHDRRDELDDGADPWYRRRSVTDDPACSHTHLKCTSPWYATIHRSDASDTAVVVVSDGDLRYGERALSGCRNLLLWEVRRRRWGSL